ncbi:MAG: transposase [Chromatiaceae bacterium]|nr:transposase [Chromatiaceae bacterium]
MANTLKGSCCYRYLFMDVAVCSRKIVGWAVFAQESAKPAAAVFTAAYQGAGVPRQTLVLHADNGSPMKGATLLATRQRLGVVPSFSRPAVSNDNPYSEALFKTLKYQPDFPAQPFDGLASARRWVAGFVAGYNEAHRHRALKFVTPGQRHRGEDQALLAGRRGLYAAAKAQYPERWSGAIRNGEPDAVVLLNPGKPLKQEPQSTPTTA